MAFFGILLWIISAINITAFFYFIAERPERNSEPKSDTGKLPYTPDLIGFSVLFAMVCPGANLWYLKSSVKILREPAQKLWKKILTKVSIWLH